MENNPLESLERKEKPEVEVGRRLEFTSNADLANYFKENMNLGAVKRIERQVGRANQRNELVWGWTDKDYEEDPVTDTIHQRVCIFVGANIAGSGKTVLVGNIVEQLRAKLDCHIVLFDSKPEFQYRLRPQNNPEILRRINVVRQDLNWAKPQGWDLVSVAPDFVVGPQFEGSRIRYDTSDMEWVDIQTLFNLKEDVSSHAKTSTKLNMAVHGIASEEEFVRILQTEEGVSNYHLANTEQLLNSFMSGMVKDDMLKKSFQNMLMNRVIGQSMNTDIVRFLNQDRVLQYVTRIASDENLKSKVLAYMAIAIRQITRAREAHIQPRYAARTPGRLRKPVFLVFTEFQTCFPRAPYNPSTKIEINSIYDKFRWMNVGVIADATGFRKVDGNALKQSDYIVAFKTTGDELRYLQRQLNLSYENEELIAGLQSNKNDPPFEAALIPQGAGQTERLRTFYPLPPMSAIQQAQRY